MSDVQVQIWYSRSPLHLDFVEETPVTLGWSGGAKVLGKLPVPGRPTNLDYSRARAYCACNRCGWGVVWTFFSLSITSFPSPSLWETARYRLKYCPKGPFNPEQPTNHPVTLQIEFRHVEKRCGSQKTYNFRA